MAYFSLLNRMQKTTICQKVFRMISSDQNLKHKMQRLNIFGQKQIIKLDPVFSDCLGHLVPIYAGIVVLSTVPWMVVLTTVH